MAKIMVVEDDQSLREIYSIRLTAEGYEVVSAGDGEEALAVAVKERPDLVLSDVMMPKISGFDMLDILRSTPETKDIKVIMMTALSSDDQKKRGESLGADKYLVKSQVGIEDVIAAVHEVMRGGQPQQAQAAPTDAAQAQSTPEMTPSQPAPTQQEGLMPNQTPTTPEMVATEPAATGLEEPQQMAPTLTQSGMPVQPERLVQPVVSTQPEISVQPGISTQPEAIAQPEMPAQTVVPNPGELNASVQPQPGFPPVAPAQ